MTDHDTPAEFVCCWCERRATDRSTFPTYSETCRDQAAAYRERELRRWRLFP